MTRTDLSGVKRAKTDKRADYAYHGYAKIKSSLSVLRAHKILNFWPFSTIIIPSKACLALQVHHTLLEKKRRRRESELHCHVWNAKSVVSSAIEKYQIVVVVLLEVFNTNVDGETNVMILSYPNEKYRQKKSKLMNKKK